MKKINKVAGFWIRFLARIIDFVIFIAPFITVAIFGLQNEQKLSFKSPAYFYLWISLGITWMFLNFVIIPYFWSKTLGMFLCKIKIKFKDKHIFVSLIKRELFFSVTWMFSMFLLMIFINHTLIDKFLQSDQKNISYTAWENFRITLFVVPISILVLMQLISAISVIIKKSKGGIHDVMSNTLTIWVNKFEIAKQKNSMKFRRPKLVENTIVEWKE